MGSELVNTADGVQVIGTIHANDGMRTPGAEQWYFRMGESALACIQRALGCAGLSFEVKTDSILDLPSGYGRVLRFLRVAYPDAAITASDILEEAVDFCVETFGVNGLYSANDPRDIETGTYDLIWCGSLLTHLPEEMWDPWLSFFEEHLNPNGSVVFTTHGEPYANGYFPMNMPPEFPKMQAAYRNTGFAFRLNPDYRELGHGISFSSPTWVMERLGWRHSLRITAFMERTWHDAHDVWCATKVPEPRLEIDMQRARQFDQVSNPAEQ